MKKFFAKNKFEIKFYLISIIAVVVAQLFLKHLLDPVGLIYGCAYLALSIRLYTHFARNLLIAPAKNKSQAMFFLSSKLTSLALFSYSLLYLNDAALKGTFFSIVVLLVAAATSATSHNEKQATTEPH